MQKKKTTHINLITHYGLFWSEKDVWWGSPGAGNEGKLLGQASRRAKEEDFRNYVGVYCLHDDERLLYAGQAGIRGEAQALFARIKQHREPRDIMAGKWNFFSWFGRKRRSGTPGLTLEQLEAVMIAVTNPPFNRKQGSFHEAKLIFQVPDEKAEGNLVKQIADLIREKIK